jgi:hypothetical protein
VKLAGLAAVLADGLRERGVPDPEARLVAESAITVLRVGFDRWVAADSPDLARTLRQVLAELLALSLDPS